MGTSPGNLRWWQWYRESGQESSAKWALKVITTKDTMDTKRMEDSMTMVQGSYGDMLNPYFSAFYAILVVGTNDSEFVTTNIAETTKNNWILSLIARVLKKLELRRISAQN